jgi:hypothetical protein
MSFFPRKTSKRPPPVQESGEHEAVRTYRDKLQSITDGALEATKTLDEELAEYLAATSPQPVEK